MSTFERVQKIICEQLEIDRHLVTEDASISGDLGADSLDLVDLAMSIEEEFNIEVPDDALDNVRTVNDIVKFIDDHE
ncbi:MAG: acyl carrier protein [Clostridia bacterium]|nr:acyl carrier protein [Clostridia bacterium]